jgi:hypothetical protein
MPVEPENPTLLERARPAAAKTGSLFKSETQRSFCLAAQHQMKGRYLLLLEVSVGVIAGDEVQSRVRSLLPQKIDAEKLYPVSLCTLLVAAAWEEGISPRRLGSGLMLKAKQSWPQIFPKQRASLSEMMAGYDRILKLSTDYGGNNFKTSRVAPTQVLITREDNPHACEFLAGLIEGLFRAFGHRGIATETACRWLGYPACEFLVQLDKPID